MLIDKETERVVLHSLKHYKKKMGTDLTTFAQSLNVTRQRVRVVARQHNIALPFSDESSLRMEAVLRLDAEELRGKIEVSRNGESVKDADYSRSFDPTKTKSTPTAKTRKTKFVYTRSNTQPRSKGEETTENVEAVPETPTKATVAWSIPANLQEYLIANVESPWTGLAKETGLSLYKVRTFLSGLGFAPKAKKQVNTVDKPKEKASPSEPKVKGVRGRRSVELPESVKTHLKSNAHRSWTHLARETGCSLSVVMGYLRKEGFERPSNRKQKL